ncbi:hypothetical protein S14_40 [Shewanella sp. phage 1/4]|uniref:hypothetical protein n=1 Tax=Shewanella phage 1/4 TaxID=1458859 RepID=UPI0004F7D51A|nr:hypothetical protein S14_40 [Shewanella sp. phage 1/4]AHK11152.1 hypothetical protein S14_40 [Shewanella sp. phage 1/4]
MVIDIQVLLTFYIFLLVCVATNKDMQVREFKSQILIVMMSAIGWLMFKCIQFISSFI